MAAEEVIIQLRLDGARQFSAEAQTAGTSLGSIDEGAKKADKSTKKFGGKMALLGPAMVSGAAAAGGLAVAIGVKGVAAYTEAWKIGQQTNAVIKSTGGIANVTADQVSKLAGQLSKQTGIDDEVIQSGQNMLLTFKNIRNEAGRGNKIFDRSTKTLIDMSTALGTDPQQAAVQLGKALNDPIKGISALSRVGVTFTEKQKARIQGFVDEGKTMNAQKLILKELNSEFGGSAKAQATNVDRMKVALGNLLELIGSKLAPVIEKATGWLLRFGQSGQGMRVLRTIGTALAPVFRAVGGVIKAMVWALKPLLPLAVSLLPVLKFLGKLIGIGLVMYFKMLTINIRIFGRALRVVVGVITFVIDKLTDLVAFVRTLPGKISSAATGMWDGLKDSFKSAINWIIDGWNGLEFKIPGFDPPGPGPKFGGFTLGLPNVPHLATGGTIRTGGTALVGERGPELVTLPTAATVTPTLPGGGQTTAHFYLDRRLIATAVAKDTADRRARR